MALTSISTSRKHRTTARTRQTTGLPLPPCHTFLFSNQPSQRCQVRIDRQQTASTNSYPPGAAGPATQIATQQRTLVPAAYERGSPHCDSAKVAGGGRLKVVKGRRRRGDL